MSFLPLSSGWTAGVHLDIAWNAYHKTSVNGRRFLRHHLGRDVLDIANAATWADSVDAKSRYPISEEYHFSHTPYRACSEFDMKRDCGSEGSGRCLVTGIAEMTIRSVDPQLSIQERQDALKFVLHLLADIHQPLHTGFAEDAGGSRIVLESEPVMSLHQLWDFALFGQASDPIWKTPMIGLPDRISTLGSMIGYASALATESSTQYTCKHAYISDNGEYIVPRQQLTGKYMRSRAEIAQERIAHAASRLADLVDVMASTFFENRAKLRIASRSGEQQRSGGILASNSFSMLDFEEVADLFEESLQLYRTQVVLPAPRIEAAESMRSDIEILEEEIEAEARRRAAAQDQERPSDCSPVAGVPMESFVIIRRGRFFLTRIEFLLANPNYNPLGFGLRRGTYTDGRGTRSIEIAIDENLSSESISGSELARIFMYLEGHNAPRDAAGGDCDDGLAKGGGGGANKEFPRFLSQSTRDTRKSVLRHNIIGRRVVDGYIKAPPLPLESDSLATRWIAEAKTRARQDVFVPTDRFAKIENKLDFDFFSKLRSIVRYYSDEIEIYFLNETISDPAPMRRRLNVVPCSMTRDGKVRESLAVFDTAIYDGIFTTRINDGLRIYGRAFDDRKLLVKSPTAAMEVRDLRKLLIQSDASKMRIIENMVQYESPTHPKTMWVVEYEIKSENTTDS